jgi:hypothetical protein
MLRDRIPAARRNRLAVLVIDVSGPPVAGKKRTPSAAKKGASAKKSAKSKGNKPSRKTSTKKLAAKKGKNGAVVKKAAKSKDNKGPRKHRKHRKRSK